MEVTVTNIYGRSQLFFVDETWTVFQIKSQYAQQLGSSISNWYLMFDGKFLQDQNFLVSYNIKHGSNIHVIYRHCHRMIHPVELRIVYHDIDSENSQNLSNNSEATSPVKSVLMYAEADWTIARVKREFAQLRQIQDWKSYKIFLNGNSLCEKYILTDYHIQNDAVLNFDRSSRTLRFGIGTLKKHIMKKYFLKIP